MTAGTITTGDGCDIAYRFDGPEGAPVLLLSNSLGTDMGMWGPQMPSFTERFRVLRYDSRGHGKSSSPPGSYSLDRLGRDVVELLDALNVSSVDFCGLSLGGMIGQWMGIRTGDRLRRLILANTSGLMAPASAWDSRIVQVRQSGMSPLAQASIARWFTERFASAAPEAIAPILAALNATNPVGYAGCCAAIRDMDMRRTASLITVPTLIIGGLLDPATPPEQSQVLAETIKGAKLTMLQTAHLSNVEQPKRFAEEVLLFLSRQ